MSKGKHRRPIYQEPLTYSPPLVPAYPPLPMGPQVSIQVLGSKNATVADVVISKFTDWTKGPDYQFKAAESSKREQGDVYDPMTGEMLAVARALQRLSRQMFSEANKRVKQSVAEQEAATRAAEEKKDTVGKLPPPRRTREDWLRELHGRYLKEGGQMKFEQWARETQGYEPPPTAHDTLKKIIEGNGVIGGYRSYTGYSDYGVPQRNPYGFGGGSIV